MSNAKTPYETLFKTRQSPHGRRRKKVSRDPLKGHYGAFFRE